MISQDTVIERNSRVAYHELDPTRGGVLLHLDTGAYHGLNQVGFLVWQALGERRSFGQLVGVLRHDIMDPPKNLDDVIAAFVRDLSERDLLLLHQPAP